MATMIGLAGTPLSLIRRTGVSFRYPLSQAICSIADRAVRVQNRRLARALLLENQREQAVDRLPGNLCDPLLAEVRDDVQGQVPGVCLLAVRLDIGSAEEHLRIRRERDGRPIGRARLHEM